MAIIEARKTGTGRETYRVRIRMKGFPEENATFERKTDAKRWAQQTEAAMREGRYFRTSEAKRHTVADLVDRYIKDYLTVSPPANGANTKRQLTWWKAQIGSVTLADLSGPLLTEYRDKLGTESIKRGKKTARRTPSTVRRYLAALSTALSTAMKDWHWLDDNPMRKVGKPKEPPGRMRWLSDEERAALLAACQSSTQKALYPIVVLAISTGMRRGEILGLRWREIDLIGGWINLTKTKNNDIRTVPLNGVALQQLKAWSKVRSIANDLVFPGKNPRTPFALDAPWKAALTTAGVSDFRFHDLRHSAASYLAMNGASTVEIAAVLGHKTLQMTKRYSHFGNEHLKKRVAAMNRKIFSERAA